MLFLFLCDDVFIGKTVLNLLVIGLFGVLAVNVDIAILETGLGGRLDSVTACDSDILVCTSISKDHQHFQRI